MTTASTKVAIKPLEDRIVVQANEEARGLFRMTSRDIGRPLQDLEFSYRPAELRSHIDQAYRHRQPTTEQEAETAGRVG